ncbi:hypothetical protein VTJ04DRAFT_9399 [Mycothermus thermophilus]|uniref:uncharacterized protein n=1 Tax=Humicola insolens TaxID=85995 RepID=UPI0037445F8F
MVCMVNTSFWRRFDARNRFSGSQNRKSSFLQQGTWTLPVAPLARSLFQTSLGTRCRPADASPVDSTLLSTCSVYQKL